MNKVPIGVVGAGHLGFHHIRILSRHPKAKLVGIFDINEDRAKEVSRRWDTRAFGSLESLLREVDAVTCVVPTVVHYEVGKRILEEGKHLLLEKPMARTQKEALELMEIAKRKGVKFQIGHIERFNPAVLAVERLINSPKYAECHRLSPYSARGVDVDVVLDLMIHDLDLVLHFFKKRPVKVDAVGIPVLTDKADIATARIIFEGGEIANLTASRISSEKQRKLRFFQKNAYFSIDCLNRDVKAFIKDDDGILPLFPPIDREKEPLFMELDSFLTSILEDKPPAVRAEEAFEALLLALRVTQNLTEYLSKISLD